MRIKLPPINGENKIIEDKQSIVLIGANGSGKTRMSVWIADNNSEVDVHRISAQKSLNMPSRFSTSELDEAKENFIYGLTNSNKEYLKRSGKRDHRWGGKPETFLLDDFSKLMEYLATEDYKKSIEYKSKHRSGEKNFDNETKLETVISIWGNILIHRKLKNDAGKIEVYKKEDNDNLDIVNTDSENENSYNGSEMSDGERAIFYFIGEVLSAPDKSIIIIDEPENHLHKSILFKLWNVIENCRPDCAFVYITHSLEFASSRINSSIIWVKEYNGNESWEYEIIEDVCASDDLMLEILGNRHKVLLVEGTPDKSIDIKLYSALFSEYNVIPLEGCDSVIQYTKAYSKLKEKHYLEIKGIIDRDRRSQDDIEKYKKESIYAPDVAEIENLFLLPEIIKFVAKKQSVEDKRCDEIIYEIKAKTFEFLEKEKESQALLFTKQKARNVISEIVNSKSVTINKFEDNLSAIKDSVNASKTHADILIEIQKIIDSGNFLEALKMINNKGLLPYTGLTSYFGWKKDYYIDYVLRLVNSNTEEDQVLKDIFMNYITIV